MRAWRESTEGVLLRARKRKKLLPTAQLSEAYVMPPEPEACVSLRRGRVLWTGIRKLCTTLLELIRPSGLQTAWK